MLVRSGSNKMGGKKSLEFITSMDGDEIPEAKKPKITSRSQRDIIECHGKVYEVPVDMLYYLANLRYNLPARIDKTIENGMGMMYPDGVFACWYCNHYTHNLRRLHEKSRGDIVVHSTEGQPGVGFTGCTYKGDPGIRWATRFEKSEPKIAVMAQRTPCVVDQTMISFLHGRGLLDEYEVGREFDFPTLDEIDRDPELMSKFRLKKLNWLW